MKDKQKIKELENQIAELKAYMRYILAEHNDGNLQHWESMEGGNYFSMTNGKFIEKQALKE